MRAIHRLLVLLSFALIAATASADWISAGEIGAAGKPAEERDAIQALLETSGLQFDFKHDYPNCDDDDPEVPLPDPCNGNEGTTGWTGDGTGAASSGSYTVGDFLNEPAYSDVSWTLPSGWGLAAIGVKTAQIIHVYKSEDGPHMTGSDVRVFTHPSENKGSISHISFFVTQIDGGGPGPTPIPEPGTLGLLGLGLLGLGLRRRRTV